MGGHRSNAFRDVHFLECQDGLGDGRGRREREGGFMIQIPSECRSVRFVVFGWPFFVLTNIEA